KKQRRGAMFARSRFRAAITIRRTGANVGGRGYQIISCHREWAAGPSLFSSLPSASRGWCLICFVSPCPWRGPAFQHRQHVETVQRDFLRRRGPGGRSKCRQHFERGEEFV